MPRKKSVGMRTQFHVLQRWNVREIKTFIRSDEAPAESRIRLAVPEPATFIRMGSR